MFLPVVFSDYLALFAVLLSAVSLYISYRGYQRDASHLKIGLKYGPDPVRGGCYKVRITNTGRRPASIARVYARVDNGKRYPVMDDTTLLAETQFKEILVPMIGFRNRPASAIRAFEVEETSGRLSRASTWRQWWRKPS